MAPRVRTVLLLSLGLLAADLAFGAIPARASGRLVERGAAPKDTAPKDTAPKDTAPKDAAGDAGSAWTLTSARFTARVRASVAHVRVDHVFQNRSETPLEADFVFPLPPGATLAKLALRPTAVQQMAVQAGVGRVGDDAPARVDRALTGVVLRGAAARAMWMADLKRRRDPGLVRHVGADVYRVALPPLAGGAVLALTLTYEQTLDSAAGLAELACPLHEAATYSARIDLETQAPLGPIYSPTHALEIARTSPHRATIRYAGKSTPCTPCFAVFWSTTRSRVGMTFLTYWPKSEARGYYLLMAEPGPSTRQRGSDAARAKNISFVVDVSASMSGRKLEGMRVALLRTIKGLTERDQFNIVTYQSTVRTLWPAPHRALPGARAEARAFVRGLRAAGHTNMGGALRTALGMPRPTDMPSVMLFLTDGRPTVGETDADKILAAVATANAQARTRIFVLGIGVDVNTVMLDRLALDNGGLPSFVRPEESVEARFRGLYSQIRHPVLTDVTLAARGMQVTDTVAQRLPDLFEGANLVFAGRYSSGGPVELILSGTDGLLEREYHYTRAAARRGEGQRSDFAARVWATRRIATLVDAIRLRGSEQPALVDEVVRLSSRFGILTEYTTFLAEESCGSCADLAANAQRTRLNFKVLAPKDFGGAGFAQAKSQVERRSAERVANDAGAWFATPDDRNVRRVALAGVRHVGNRTFYYRGLESGWVDACVDHTHAPQATIERWSPAFFELLGSTSREENARLALAGPVLLELQGRILRIVDPS